MLACFERWGVRAALQKFNGMFALALWDREERVLHLSRDRMGEKPLYYGWLGRVLLFGSELKALRAYPGFSAEINREALTLYLRRNYVPSPHSIYKGVFKLQAGTLLSLASDADRGASPCAYWSLKEVAERGAAAPFRGTEQEALEEFETLLRASVRMRMLSDVPLGALLSGGVDSSMITAMMQAQSPVPIKTFSIGLWEREYDEAEDAAKVAQHLGTAHTELYVTPAEALAVIPKLPLIYDEPFADSSQIPTFLVSQLAREQVTVGLSGDGGDELFGGYTRHVWSAVIWNKAGIFPAAARRAVAAAITKVSPQGWDSLFRFVNPILPAKQHHRLPGQKLHKLARILESRDFKSVYLSLISHWDDPTSLVIGAGEFQTIPTAVDEWADLPDFVQQMMFLYALTFLPDDILVKVDRASMAVSLEMRVPLLDHRVVEFAWRLPASMRQRDRQGKWLLRQLLCRYIPKRLTERPKCGFSIPLETWLRGPLRDWAESLLAEDRLRNESIFNPKMIRKKWAEHLAGRGTGQHALWGVLMFQAWLADNSRTKAEAELSAVSGS
jgi:asparagine synthase (glutamine-hydrolysing)